MGFRQFALRAPLLGPAIETHCRERMIAILLGEPFQGRDKPGVPVRRGGDVPAPDQPGEVRIQEGGLIGIPRVEAKQGLVKADRLEGWSIGVRGVRRPGQEPGGASKIGPAA